jgi:HAMP domain-containing protein
MEKEFHMKWSIRKKLSWSFAVILAILVISTAISVVLSTAVRKTSENIADYQFPTMKQLDELTIKLYRKRIVYDQYFPTKSRKHLDEITKIRAEFDSIFVDYKNKVSDSNKAFLEQLIPEMEEYNKKLDETLVYTQRYPDNLDGMLKQIAIADNHFDQKIAPIIEKMQGNQKTETDDKVEKLQQDLKNSDMITVGVGIFAIILGSIFAAALGKGISKPVVDLTKAADEISMGKIDTSINVKTNDEINELAQAIERMRMSLKKAMERLTKMREQ